MSHRIAFDDQRVVDAIRRVGRMLVGDGYVAGSRRQAVIPNFWEAFESMAFKDEACAIAPAASFVPAFFGAGGQVAENIGVFPFPAVSGDFADSRVGGGIFAVAVSDRPETRALLRAIASPSWGSAAAAQPFPVQLPANLRFDRDSIANDEYRQVFASIQGVIAAGQFVFDGSDSMASAIGGANGAFLEGMVRLVTEATPENLDRLSLEIAQDIENAWLALEEAEG